MVAAGAATPMMNLSKPAQDEALLNVGRLCVLRRNGGYSEDEIAQKLGFNSAAVMHMQLENLGLPGLITKAPSGQGKQRKARSSGDATKLPAAADAKELFRRDLKRLQSALDELPSLEEYLQSERFVTYSKIEDGEVHYHKSMFPDEAAWQEFCQTYGENPASEELWLPVEPFAQPRGARVTPWPGLTHLIAMHALMNGSVDGVIAALHPSPDQVDRTELYKKRGLVQEFKSFEAKIAKVVRGSKTREGKHAGEVSREDHHVAWELIRSLYEKGYSDKEIHDRLKEEGDLDEDGRFAREKYTVDDITRLRHLHLPLPVQGP